MKEYELGRYVICMEGLSSVNKILVGKSEGKI
jgi:hypothetical protein